LQEKLLSAEVEKFRAGMSTNFAVIQQETYLAQAEATEVAAQAAWRKPKFNCTARSEKHYRETGSRSHPMCRTRTGSVALPTLIQSQNSSPAHIPIFRDLSAA
jgi:hypothetical protein